MTDRPSHRAAAERLLADADEWAAQAGELSPKASERACLDRAQVHALLAIHATLTAADRYATNEAKQREEAESDPLDEGDHRDRLTADRLRIVRHGRGHWHTPAIYGKWCDADCTEMSLQDWAHRSGPLAFAPDTTQEAAGGDLTASGAEGGPTEGSDTDDAQNAILCPECDDHINTHNVMGCRHLLCDCPRTPEDVARALISAAVKAEREAEND